MDKVPEVFRFIDFVVRQTCRRAHYDHLTRTKPSQEDKDSIYSIDYLKKVYDKPREYIYQIVKNPQKTLKGIRVENNTPLPEKEIGFTKIEQKILLDFLRKVQDLAPKLHFILVDLQHNLFYAYRNFASQEPKATLGSLSPYFVCEMKEFINCLKQDDESQIWLRIFTLIREYCIFAQWHYSQNDQDEPIKKFFIYYEAMLSAATALIPVFSDFEDTIIYKNYKICWVDFNTLIFIRFFYESDRVKIRIEDCLKNKKSSNENPQLFNLMHRVMKTWLELERRVSIVSQDRKLPDNSQEGIREKRALAAHKKLLSATFWVDRDEETKKIIDLQRLDDNLFALLRDKLFFPEGPGLNKNGQCICEECLITKYKIFVDYDQDFSILSTDERACFCRKCKLIVNLDHFQRHVNFHIEDVPKDLGGSINLYKVVTEKIDDVNCEKTAQLTEMFNSKLKLSGDLLNKTKLAYEKYRKDSRFNEKQDMKNGKVKLREELMMNGFEKYENDKVNAPYINRQQISETAIILKEIRKNGHRPFQKNDGGNNVMMMSCETGESTIDQLLLKKCECTYCEIFANNKLFETKEKIKLRLYRKGVKPSSSSSSSSSSSLSNKPTVVERENIFNFNIDNRIFLTSSPFRVPDIIENPGGLTNMNNEIRGLVNFIEGTPAKSKAELAEKKAAKKARQREKKEQEKLQAELVALEELEVLVRQEEERKRELQKEKEQLEEQRKIEEAKLKKKLKKQRQALKRHDLLNSGKITAAIEETIPAMITIKRIPGEENGVPSVTITLKGCTPDQDKLITTLVEDQGLLEKIQTQKVIESTINKPKPKNLLSKVVMENPLKNHPKTIAKDVKVTLALDKTMQEKLKDTDIKRERGGETSTTKDEMFGNLKLPPGITITKVEGPVSSKKTYLTTAEPHSSTSSSSSSSSSVLDKTGVIVVDTERLIQQKSRSAKMINNNNNNTISNVNNKPLTNNNINNNKKKKKDKKMPNSSKLLLNAESTTADKPKMITLRNPMFQQLQNQNLVKNPVVVDESAPATIFTSENGMVTIRSSRLQQSLANGIKNPNNPSSNSSAMGGLPLRPELLGKPIQNFQSFNNNKQQNNDNDIKNVTITTTTTTTTTQRDAQEILSGLPGIEITKIDKKTNGKMLKDGTMESSSSSSLRHDPHVSIIPSNGGNEFDLDFDKDDDWLYENVFKPRDVLEDDMDDDELELEAFKRFCQQSVPPKEKKVAHFNVADIVLQKKKLT